MVIAPKIKPGEDLTGEKFPIYGQKSPPWTKKLASTHTHTRTFGFVVREAEEKLEDGPHAPL